MVFRLMGLLRRHTSSDPARERERTLRNDFRRLAAAHPGFIVAEGFGGATLRALIYRALRPRTRVGLWVRHLPRARAVGEFVLSHVDGIFTYPRLIPTVEKLAMPGSRIFPLVDLEQIAPSSDDSNGRARHPQEAYRLVYAGDLVPQAGLADILACAASWAEQRPDRTVECWWIGEGSLRGILEAQPLPSNMTQRFLGALPPSDVAKAFTECGIFVVAALIDDRQPLVVEAMWSGLPVLGSVRSGAVRDWVADGKNGWLFDPLSPEQTSAALARALDTPVATLEHMRAFARTATGTVHSVRLTDRLEQAIAAIMQEHGIEADVAVRT